jgi:hypothetical protein
MVMAYSYRDIKKCHELTIEITLENVTINGNRLRCDEDWPNGLLKEGNVKMIYR